MTASITLTHVYSPDQYLRAVNAWERLVGNHLTSLTVEDGRWSRYGTEEIPAEQLYALIVSDGEGTADWAPVTLTLAEYSDYGGHCCDAANVRSLEGTPGVTVSKHGIHGAGSAWLILGELPDLEDVDNGIAILEDLADTFDRLTDYPLISDEDHSDYVTELAEEAWEQWLGSDVVSELAELAGCDTYEFEDFGYGEETIREMYYSYEESEWNCETATSVVNARHDDTVKSIFDHIISEWRKPWIDPNQLQLY